MVLTIDGKFAANKDLVDQLAKANSVALQAALLTQEKSAAKFELSVGDQLKQLSISFDSANKATNEKIDRLTSRMDTGEGRGNASNESKQDRTTDKGQLIAIVSVLIALVSLAFVILRSR
jgi:hypothetical protein